MDSPASRSGSESPPRKSKKEKKERRERKRSRSRSKDRRRSRSRDRHRRRASRSRSRSPRWTDSERNLHSPPEGYRPPHPSHFVDEAKWFTREDGAPAAFGERRSWPPPPPTVEEREIEINRAIAIGKAAAKTVENLAVGSEAADFVDQIKREVLGKKDEAELGADQLHLQKSRMVATQPREYGKDYGVIPHDVRQNLQWASMNERFHRVEYHRGDPYDQSTRGNDPLDTFMDTRVKPAASAEMWESVSKLIPEKPAKTKQYRTFFGARK